MFNNSINLKGTKKVDHILERSLDFKFFFDELYVIYQLSEIDIQVVSQFPCLLGPPVPQINQTIHKRYMNASKNNR